MTARTPTPAPVPAPKSKLSLASIANDIVIVGLGAEGALEAANQVATGLHLPQADMAVIAVATAAVVKVVTTVQALISDRIIPAASVHRAAKRALR